MRVTFSDFTHDDIVNILSSTAFSSDMIEIGYNKANWMALPPEKRTENPCLEDICADLLLAGKSIYLTDLESEKNESSIRKGRVVKMYNFFGEEFRAFRYTIKLNDFIAAASTKDGSEYLVDFMKEVDDLYTSEGFLQVVMFGSVIYG